MPKRAPPDPAPEAPTTATAQADKALATAGYRKVMAGQKPTAQEQAALRRFEKAKEEKLRWAYYSSIPQKHWRQMSGRQTKILHDQAATYGLPFGGPKIDLPAVVRKFHDFLAANARKLASDDDELLQGTSSEALEEYRRERAALARMDRLEREGSLVRRDVMHERLGRVAAHIRGIGEALQRQFGPDAARLLAESLDDLQAEIDGGSADEAA